MALNTIKQFIPLHSSIIILLSLSISYSISTLQLFFKGHGVTSRLIGNRFHSTSHLDEVKTKEVSFVVTDGNIPQTRNNEEMVRNISVTLVTNRVIRHGL
jgi:hypothetical protein